MWYGIDCDGLTLVGAFEAAGRAEAALASKREKGARVAAWLES